LGNITVTQAVDLDTLESDVATNNAKISFDSTSSSKLAGIEENADVTDATNVAAAGAMMTGVAVLNDLSDVSGTPSDGQVLTYDTVNGWQPETAASAPVTSVNSETGAVVLDADDISDATTTNKFTTQTDIDKLAGIETGAEVNTVDSVNTQTGAVVLDADDIDDSTTTNKFTTQTDIDKLAGIESGAEVNTVDSVNGETGVVVLDADDIDDTSTTNKFTTQTDIDKLAGIEAGAEVNDIDGSGTANNVAKWSDADTLTDSVIYDDGTNVGIGTSSPVSLTHISSGYSAPTGGVDSNVKLIVSNNPTTQSFAGIGILSGNNAGSFIHFGDTDDSDVGGIAYFHNDNFFRILTEGSQRVRIDSDGLKFNGDSAAANALDDYEEGTWTPVYQPSIGSFATITMNTLTAKYTKIGNMVTVYAVIRTSNVDVTGGSGEVRIGGLPFTVSAFGGGIALGLTNNFTNAPDGGHFFNATTQITLRKTNISTGLVVADLSDGTNANHNALYFSGTYMA
jgi:hypothetical protein